MFCRAAYDLAVKELPVLGRNYLEIGVFAGDAVFDLAGRFPATNFHGIDPFIEDGYTKHTTCQKQGAGMPVQQQQARANFAAWPNAWLHEMTSEQFDHDYSDSRLSELDVGFVLIDGDHHFAAASLDGGLAMRLIGSGAGVVVWDDCNLPEVNQAYQAWLVKYQDRIGSVKDIYSAHVGHILAHWIPACK